MNFIGINMKRFTIHNNNTYNQDGIWSVLRCNTSMDSMFSCNYKEYITTNTNIKCVYKFYFDEYNYR